MAIGSTIANMVKSLRRRVRLGLVAPFQEGLYGQIAVETNPASLMKANRHWVHFCANLNSSSVAAVPLRLYVSKASASQKTLVPTKSVPFARLEYMESRPELQHWMRKGIAIDEVQEHPLLNLFKAVNPFMGIYSLLELTNWAQELTGNAYWYIVGNGLGLPGQLWPLPSHRMQPILTTKKKLVSGYVFDKGLPTQTIYNADEIVHFKFPNPADFFMGRSPLQAIIASYNTFEHVQTYQLSIFKNLGTPSVYLQSDKHVSDADKERTLEMLRNEYGGTGRAGKVAFLTGGLKFERVQFTPMELALLEGKKGLKEEILGAYGVPVSKTTSENVNKANADAGERQYQRDTVKPRIRRLEEMINEFLTFRYAENIFVAFDNPVPEDDKIETDRENKRLIQGVITINEVREARALGPPVDWGNEPYNPNAGQIVGEEENQPKQEGEEDA